MKTTFALDVICIGEALVDFLPEQPGRRVRDVPTWHRCSGGSPANVAVGVARLGGRSAMLGVVGDDELGSYLKLSLSQEGVDVSHLRQTSEAKTGLVFISLDARGDRSFAFYRTNSAEFLLSSKDIDPLFLDSTRALHFGSNSLHQKAAQAAVLKMAKAAKDTGRLVFCDPNLRLHAWDDPEKLKGVLRELLPGCAMVKLAEDELEFVTGTVDVDLALEKLQASGVLLPMVTLGERGAAFLWKGTRVDVSAPEVPVVDTTGAGDGFVAAMIFALTRLYADAEHLHAAHVGELRQLASFACTVASRVCQTLGAVPGLPSMAELAAEAPPFLLR